MNNESPLRYVLVIEDQLSRRTIPLEEAKYSIGRHSSNTIPIYSKQISRRHATLMRKINHQSQTYSFWIIDGDLEGNKSYNGIFINGEKSLVHELKEGDLINFGCDVNASYHQIISATEMFSNSSSKLTTPMQLQDTLSSQSEQSTLIVASHPSMGDMELEKTIEKTDQETELEEDTFQEQTYLDTLTQLPNAILFKEYLSIALANSKRKKTILALCLIEINHFDQFQTIYGSEICDRILKEITSRFKITLRSGDIVSRWSNNQFAILLTKIEQIENLSPIVQRIIQAIERPIENNNNLIYLTSYQGITLYPKEANTQLELLANVENKLNKQKRNPIADQIGEQHSTFSERLSRAEIRLKAALNKDELEMYYQPQINNARDEIAGMEALIRWNHPQQGMLTSSHFWPWAEKTDLVFPLTHWILQTTFHQNQLWQEAGFPPISLCINLSSRQFYHPQLTNLLVHCLIESRLNACLIDIEVTEATILEEVNTARHILQQLQKIGVALSMDNFGVGHGAINYLQEFPFHKLKIDRSLIEKLKNNPQNTIMIETLMMIAKNFNIEVVAQGVETQQQIEILKKLDCKSMQGYLFSHPLSANEVTSLLAKRYGKNPSYS